MQPSAMVRTEGTRPAATSPANASADPRRGNQRAAAREQCRQSRVASPPWDPTGAPESESGSLWYLVQWLDGDYWRGVAPRQQETSLLIPGQLFADSPELTVRVLATSGIATGIAEATLHFDAAAVFRAVEPWLLAGKYPAAPDKPDPKHNETTIAEYSAENRE